MIPDPGSQQIRHGICRKQKQIATIHRKLKNQTRSIKPNNLQKIQPTNNIYKNQSRFANHNLEKSLVKKKERKFDGVQSLDFCWILFLFFVGAVFFQRFESKLKVRRINAVHKCTGIYYLNLLFPPSMSAKIILDNIIVKDNPASFLDNINFEVTFTALDPLPCPLSWKIIYVGSALSEDFDQTLQEFDIGPIEQNSTLKFDISCGNPDQTKIPRNELLCVTALLLTASYRGQEFIRVGYYVHNQIREELTEDPFSMPLEDLLPKIRRTIISDKPRVTKFNIDWSQGSLKKKTVSAMQENSQSLLDDFFSISNKEKLQDENSSSQKILEKEHEKHSTHEQSPVGFK